MRKKTNKKKSKKIKSQNQYGFSFPSPHRLEVGPQRHAIAQKMENFLLYTLVIINADVIPRPGLSRGSKTPIIGKRPFPACPG